MNQERLEEYLPDRLFLDDEMIRWIAEHLQTPLYVYDAEGIRNTVAEIQDAFSWNPGFRQFFPVKVLHTRAVLRLLLDAGCGLLCTTALELETARRAGASADQIIYVPAFPRDQDILAALDYGVRVVMDSLVVLRRFMQLGDLPENIGLRFAPGKRIDLGTHVMARAEGYKCGMDARELLECAKLLESKGVKGVGLHMHMSGNINRELYWGVLAGLLAEAWKPIQKKTKLTLNYLDLGGGLSIPGHPEEMLPDITKVSEGVRNQMGKDGIDVPVYTEFGRYVTGPHGLFLARTLYFKAGCQPRPVVAVDGSVSNMFRVLSNQTYYHISIAGRRETKWRKVCSAGGYMTERQDLLGTRRILPVPEPGELLAVHGAGAYAASRQALFWGDVPCAEYLLENGKLRQIRRAADPEIVFASEIDDESDRTPKRRL